MYNPWANRKLQRWFDEQAPEQFAHEVEMYLPDDGGIDVISPNGSVGDSLVFNCPTNGFNLIYQMLHILHHFFDEGIGLRQLIDYYYLLQQELSDDDRAEAVKWFRRLHIERFAAAVMYVQKEVSRTGGTMAFAATR
jgi:hypothetical protein